MSVIYVHVHVCIDKNQVRKYNAICIVGSEGGVQPVHFHQWELCVGVSKYGQCCTDSSLHWKS